MGSLVFCDSFDHYNTQTDKWTSGSPNTIDLTGAFSRTGIGCLLLNSFGPLLVFTSQSRVVFGSAYYPGGQPGTFGGIVQFLDPSSGQRQVELAVFNDMSVGVLTGNNVNLGQSAANVMVANAYNYVEMDAQISHTATVIVRVNGVVVLTLNNVDTRVAGTPALANQMQLIGIGILFGQSRHDDVYLVDPGADALGASFLGAVKIYAIQPTANSTPLNWVPLAGTNFSEVNEIPPDGDTSYVSSPNIGDIDQYVYPLTGVPGGAAIVGVQHVLDMKVDSGVRSVASDALGIVGAANALAANYFMYKAPYTTNPATAAAWQLADFPAKFGQKVTA